MEKTRKLRSKKMMMPNRRLLLNYFTDRSATTRVHCTSTFISVTFPTSKTWISTPSPIPALAVGNSGNMWGCFIAMKKLVKQRLITRFLVVLTTLHRPSFSCSKMKASPFLNISSTFLTGLPLTLNVCSALPPVSRIQRNPLGTPSIYCWVSAYAPMFRYTINPSVLWLMEIRISLSKRWWTTLWKSVERVMD